jgi:hypothetical protein
MSCRRLVLMRSCIRSPDDRSGFHEADEVQSSLPEIASYLAAQASFVESINFLTRLCHSKKSLSLQHASALDSIHT